MIGRIRNLLKDIRSHKSGNAMMIVALGLPALVGGTGFAVDTAQWYMWKRELQYAVDQAAVAGAYARSDADTEGTYIQRARQEFSANVSVTSDFVLGTPAVSLADFAGGDDNSVIVSVAASKMLPFSSFLTGDAATVSVFAQASFTEGRTFNSCLVALEDGDVDGAATIGGNAVLTAGCGLMSLSTGDESISVNGNPDVDLGFIVSAGGIDDWLEQNTDDEIIENQEGLYDPYGPEGKDVDPPYPPEAQVQRGDFTCPKGKTTTTITADAVTTHKVVTYTYYKKSGNNYNVFAYTGANKKANEDTTQTSYNVTLTSYPASNPETIGPTASGYTVVSGSGSNRVYEQSVTTTTKTYTNVQTIATTTDGGAGTIPPGTYTDLDLKCDVVFTGGVYILDGGTLEVHAQHSVIGAGVMFVLKNGAGIVINGGASVNLTAMTTSELIAHGVPAADADKLQGMLIFEDRDSSGNSGNIINGNAETVLNGTIYLPNSGLSLQGTASVTSQCLMLAAKTITITGTTNMTTFCPPGEEPGDDAGVTVGAKIRLVS
jgi:Flp pilus assembly protein TadG